MLKMIGLTETIAEDMADSVNMASRLRTNADFYARMPTEITVNWQRF